MFEFALGFSFGLGITLSGLMAIRGVRKSRQPFFEIVPGPYVSNPARFVDLSFEQRPSTPKVYEELNEGNLDNWEYDEDEIP